MQNTVSIPKFLHEVHGKKSNWFDIGATHIVALLTVVATLFLTDEMGWKKWLLILLAYDLGGGVLANFTYSTKWYYDQSMKRRLVFLSLHFLQPALMCLVFPDYLVGIITFSGYTVAASFITNSTGNPQRQLTTGALFSLSGIIALATVPVELNPALHLLLTLFLLKLPLSFSVRWYRLERFQNEPD